MSSHSLSRPRRRKVLYWIFGVLGVLLIARLVANPIIAKVVRSSLEDMNDGYRGDIRDVELSILTGEVAMLGMRIAKTNGKVPVPFMDIDRFVMGVVWEGYKPRTELVATGAHVNLVDASSKAAQQWGPTFDLADLRKQLPLELSAVRFVDGQFHFYNFEAEPKVDIAVRDLDVAWEKLTGCLPPGWSSCRSTLSGSAAVMRGGRLRLHGRFDRREGPNFYARAHLDELKPVQFNAVMLKYGKIDAQGGTVDLDVHYHNKNGGQRLVLVPRLYDIKVVGRQSGEDIKLGRELLAGMAAGFFERRRGTKAIEYEKTGRGGGSFRLIDWSDARTARAAED